MSPFVLIGTFVNLSLRVCCASLCICWSVSVVHAWWFAFSCTQTQWLWYQLHLLSQSSYIKILNYKICHFYIRHNLLFSHRLCITPNKSQLCQQLSEMSFKAEVSIWRQCCYLCPPAVAAALCGMPAFSSDVTSSLYSVWIPLASSLFDCHTTLALCYAGAQCILGIFFLPLHVAWGWEEL